MNSTFTACWKSIIIEWINHDFQILHHCCLNGNAINVAWCFVHETYFDEGLACTFLPCIIPQLDVVVLETFEFVGLWLNNFRLDGRLWWRWLRNLYRVE